MNDIIFRCIIHCIQYFHRIYLELIYCSYSIEFIHLFIWKVYIIIYRFALQAMLIYFFLESKTIWFLFAVWNKLFSYTNLSAISLVFNNLFSMSFLIYQEKTLFFSEPQRQSTEAFSWVSSLYQNCYMACVRIPQQIMR